MIITHKVTQLRVQEALGLQVQLTQYSKELYLQAHISLVLICFDYIRSDK